MSDWDDHTQPGSAEGIVPSWLATPKVTPSRPPSASDTPFAVGRVVAPLPPPPTPTKPSSHPPPAVPGTVGQSLSVGPAAVRAFEPPPPPVRASARHVADAGRAGALSASNAAADPITKAPRADRGPALDPGVEPFQLVWVDAARIGEARLDRAARDGGDDEAWLRGADFSTGGDADDGRGRASDLLGTDATESADLEARLWEGVDARGCVGRAFAVVRGEITVHVDARERLRRLCLGVEPHAAIDRRLADTVVQAKEVAAREIATDEAVRHATRRLLEVSSAVGRPIPDLEASVDCALLAERKLERRTLLGGEVAVASFSDGGPAVRCYVPAAALAELPPRRHLAARLLVEIVPPQEEDDPNEIALALVALGRRLRPAREAARAPLRGTPPRSS